MNSFLQLVQGIGLTAWAVGVVEQIRGTAFAPTAVKVKLRSFGFGWGSRAFARYAFREAPEPTRSRLQRSAGAYLVFVLCWTIGAASYSVWPALFGLLAAALVGWRLLAR